MKHSALPVVLACLAVVAGCSANEPRYLIEPPQSQTKVRAYVGSLMLREVSLPAYAAAEEIARQEADGALRDSGALWADLPVRGVTLALARQLGRITTATVAAEPWPLGGLADAVLEVRFERMIAGGDGRFHMAGQFFVAGDGAPLRPVSEGFDIVEPIAGDAVGDLVSAQSRALGQLAEQIARRLGR